MSLLTPGLLWKALSSYAECRLVPCPGSNAKQCEASTAAELQNEVVPMPVYMPWGLETGRCIIIDACCPFAPAPRSQPPPTLETGARVGVHPLQHQLRPKANSTPHLARSAPALQRGGLDAPHQAVLFPWPAQEARPLRPPPLRPPPRSLGPTPVPATPVNAERRPASA